MSTKIHHGPPGSYKTSGAIQDDIIPELLKERTVITNIRGFTKENVEQGIKHIKGGKKVTSVDVIYIDTSKEEGRERLRRFFHWAPKGAMIAIDECNTIWPIEWTAKKLHEYDFPGGLDEATKANRPDNVIEAFEMHRHHNWDFVFTTPNISKVHKIVRDTAEMAYRHMNRAVIGLKGSYWETMHAADNLGRAKGDQLDRNSKRVKQTTFGLYKSTATGDVQDTIAGRNLFSKGSTVFMGIALFGAIGYVGYNLLTSNVAQVISGDHVAETEGETPKNIEPAGNAANSGNVRAPVQGRPVGTAVEEKRPRLPLDGFNVHYHGQIGATGIFSASKEKQKQITFKTSDLWRMGYQVEYVATCFIKLKHSGTEQFVYCQQYTVTNPGEKKQYDANPVEKLKEAF